MELLHNADLVFLAGGDTQQGWVAMNQTHFPSIIRSLFMEDCIIIGLSAGAIQVNLVCK